MISFAMTKVAQNHTMPIGRCVKRTASYLNLRGVAQLEARVLWEHEAGSSSLPTPTISGFAAWLGYLVCNRDTVSSTLTVPTTRIKAEPPDEMIEADSPLSHT